MLHDKNYNNILRNKNPKINEIKINSSEATNISLKNQSITSQNLTNHDFSVNLNIQKNSDIKNQNQSKNKSLDTNKLTDYKNTAYIVLNETENGLFSHENFLKKRNKLNNHYKFFKTYNKSIDKPIHCLKGKNNPIIIDIEDNYENNHNKKRKESIIEIKDYNEKNTDLIKKQFKEIYDQKRIKWKKEDKLKELDMQSIFEIENFLFEIQNKNLLKKNKTKYNK